MIRKIKNIGLGVAAVAAMVGGWSCATDDTTDAIYVESTGEISISTTVMAPVTTRASVDASTVASEITKFGLYCYTDQRDELFNNKEVTKINGEWDYGTPEKWYANEAFDYLAYYPYRTDGLSLDDAMLSDFISDGDTPLLFACETVTNSDVVELNFTHALAAVGFSVMGDPDYEVKSITIGSIYDIADVTVDIDGTATWSNHDASSAKNSFTVDIIEDAAPYAKDDEMYGYPKNITADDGYVMAIPQTFGDYAYAKIIYDAPQDDGTTEENVVRYLKLSDYGSLESNTLYNYTVYFGDVELTYINLDKYAGLTGDELQMAFGEDFLALLESGITDIVFVGDYNEEIFNMIYGSYDEENGVSGSSIIHADFGEMIYGEGSETSIRITSLDLSDVTNFPDELPACAFANADIDLNSVVEMVVPAYMGDEEVLAYINAYSPLTSITLPDNVTEIGVGAFWGCLSLTDINLENVTQIDEGAFMSCVLLEDIDISSVTTINLMSFGFCYRLSDPDFSSVTTIMGTGEGGLAILMSPFVFCCSFETLSFPKATYVGANGMNAILYTGSDYLTIDLPKVTTIYHNSLPLITGTSLQARLTTSANIDVSTIPTSFSIEYVDGKWVVSEYTVTDMSYLYGHLVLHENKRSSVVEGGTFGVGDGYLNRLYDETSETEEVVVESDGYISLVYEFIGGENKPLVDMYGYPYIINQDQDKVYILDEANRKVALVSESVSVSTSYTVTFQIPYYSFQTDYFRWADISFVDDSGNYTEDSPLRQVEWVDISTVSFEPTTTVE